MVPFGAHQESAQNQQGQPGPEQYRGQELRACEQERGHRDVGGGGRSGRMHVPLVKAPRVGPSRQRGEKLGRVRRAGIG